ncbi:sulfatase-like hydrolase/transferase [Rhodococcus hoagii]|uniref:Sulfatase-like hydrolase/transferase n=1 Tax=Rhodococcus hoagii TaxID=43767 RepID=A0AAE4ZF08_RHOHA|nr:arylsulfatase [Prescottella equi]GBF14916.1 arylsulfatase [Rhodococcus sp. Br-6]MBM4470889.1 sulfatase-like hydrolase/transferase [Prescottella equi]MBM4484297.1 sulfatase-like hydrolase/transferase [Prescottella equi]MBM4722170.1 sulfatase-like hydrolase/transferase [Prescottella equi]NKR25423.1 sulfatase-like hydrolase/transferase [Prescottella equi]
MGAASGNRESGDFGRQILPIPDRTRAGTVLYDAKDPDSRFTPLRPLRPPDGSPNVLIVLLDDVGFGASSAFGGPAQTPTAQRLADDGLKYTRFHTTALCSPTRAALLTGRNHHTVGMGSITEMATAAPGYTSVRPDTCAPLAEILKLNGYATAHVGKCHEVPIWETSPVGPFDRWPSPGNGFEYFYGFLGGETDQWYPTLHEGTGRVEPWGTPEEGYHLTEDLADKAIAWVRQQKVLTPDKPFFLYFAPGATHAPHHVPQQWAQRYRGRFDDGWDVLRERIFARQKELGVVPADAELTRRHDAIPAWDEMDERLLPVLRRQMENYAGFLEHTDHQVGRVVEEIDRIGALDDTLVFYIIGDNGASAEGTLQGTSNELISLNGMAGIETPEFLLGALDKLGGPDSSPHYAVGWAHAMDTPYQWTKQVASHWGGTRNGTVVHWPRGFAARGEVRNQFHHVVDVAPTVLAAAGIPAPTTVNGVRQHPLEGVDMAYSFHDAAAPERHVTQYFEMLGNRGIYHRGWSAVTKHRTPWQIPGGPGIAFDDDVWELYDGAADWTQARDLAKEYPERLRELQRLFLIEATRYNVLPLDDRTFERVLPGLSGKPRLVPGNRQVLLPGMQALLEMHIVNCRNRSWSLTAQVDVPDGGARGVILNLGGHAGGWSFYFRDGRPTFCYNLFGIERSYIRAPDTVGVGLHQVRSEFAYDGGGLGKGGTVTLFVDGTAVAEGRVERTEPIGFGYEFSDVGRDSLSTVTPEYPTGDNAFTGRIDWVQIEAGEDGHDHLVDPADVVRVAMYRQ